MALLLSRTGKIQGEVEDRRRRDGMADSQPSSCHMWSVNVPAVFLGQTQHPFQCPPISPPLLLLPPIQATSQLQTPRTRILVAASPPARPARSVDVVIIVV